MTSPGANGAGGRRRIAARWPYTRPTGAGRPCCNHGADHEGRLVSLRYAYNTNGLTSHRLDEALALLADCGYDGVALTLAVAHHDPFAPDLAGRTAALRRRLDVLGLASVVETIARYLLDPRRKHHPTLVSATGRERRIAFLKLCVDVAADLGSEAISFWA